MSRAHPIPDPAVLYVEGDATAPRGRGLKIVAHCCNDIGAWGAGFVRSLSREWPGPEAEYRSWHAAKGGDLPLGAVQIVPVERDVHVANIIGQHGIRPGKGGVPPIRYEAISAGFGHVARYATERPEEVSIHMPRLGCCLAGGSWARIEPLIDQHFVTRGLPVTVYDWPGGRFNP